VAARTGRGPLTVPAGHKEQPMAKKPSVKIVLTPEQQAQVQAATGKPVQALTLKLEELETRLAPGITFN
jgi:hypothetical protein